MITCPECGMPYDPKSGVVMLNCIDCGTDLVSVKEQQYVNPDANVEWEVT